MATSPLLADRKRPKILDHLRVYPPQADGEGHLVEHHFTHGEHESERHVFADSEGDEALAHVAKHARIQGGEMKKGKVKVEKVNLGKKGSFNVRKGALHRALGIPEKEKIGETRIRKAERSKNPEVRAEAHSAEGLTHMKKN